MVELILLIFHVHKMFCRRLLTFLKYYLDCTWFFYYIRENHLNLWKTNLSFLFCRLYNLVLFIQVNYFLTGVDTNMHQQLCIHNYVNKTMEYWLARLEFTSFVVFIHHSQNNRRHNAFGEYKLNCERHWKHWFETLV